MDCVGARKDCGAAQRDTSEDKRKRGMGDYANMKISQRGEVATQVDMRFITLILRGPRFARRTICPSSTEREFKLQNSQFAIYGIDRDVASGLSPKALSL
jgi:hypothetical protein